MSSLTTTETAPSLPQPEPGLRPEEIIARAQSMIPMLRDQQNEADARGHFSPDVLQQFIDAGFYRILQPKKFGGYEFDYVTHLEVVYRIAQGHPSSGWCFCLSANSVLVVSSFMSPEGQAELFGTTGEYRSPHRMVPGGEVRVVDGGYRISGRWSFASGSPVSNFFMGNTLLTVDGAPPKNLVFVIPRENVTILEDWGDGAALGMQGSGSNTVVVNDVFVPQQHVVQDDVLYGTSTDFAAGTEGTRLHGNPRYLGLLAPFYHLAFTAVLAGTAQAAVARLREIMPVTRRIGSPLMMDTDPDAVRALGRAGALADASHAAMQAAGARMEALFSRWAADGQPITPEELMRCYALGRQGAMLGAEAVQVVFQSAGARASVRGEKLQRYLRDSQMYLVHAAAQPRIDEARGEAELGKRLTLLDRYKSSGSA